MDNADDVNALADRLRYYNDWRRGGDTEMPEPKQIGDDIDEAISILEELENEPEEM